MMRKTCGSSVRQSFPEFCRVNPIKINRKVILVITHMFLFFHGYLNSWFCKLWPTILYIRLRLGLGYRKSVVSTPVCSVAMHFTNIGIKRIHYESTACRFFFRLYVLHTLIWPRSYWNEYQWYIINVDIL